MGVWTIGGLLKGGGGFDIGGGQEIAGWGGGSGKMKAVGKALFQIHFPANNKIQTL